MKTVFVTGAGRGLGLEFVRQFLDGGHKVIAGVRNPDESGELVGMQNLNAERCLVVRLDVTSSQDRASAAAAIEAFSGGLDILVNNAGCFACEEGLQTLKDDSMLGVFHVNAVAPAMVAQAFLPLLKKSPRPVVANIISGTGFLKKAGASSNGQYSYRGSKAALNIFTVLMADDLRDHGIVVAGLNPGFVLTDMTRKSPVPPPLLPSESVRGMIRCMENIRLSDSGGFFDWRGETCA